MAPVLNERGDVDSEMAVNAADEVEVDDEVEEEEDEVGMEGMEVEAGDDVLSDDAVNSGTAQILRLCRLIYRKPMRLTVTYP